MERAQFDLNNPAHLLARQFRDARDMTLTVVKDFEGESAFFRPTQSNNPAIWIVGHMLLYTGDEFRKILKLGKRKLRFELGKHLATGGGYDPNNDYPPFSAMVDVLEEEKDELVEAISKTTVEELKSHSPENLREWFPTICDLISATIAHEYMHCGQLLFLRRSVGKPPLFG